MKFLLYKLRRRCSILLNRISGKTQHASNANYKIHKNVFKQILAGGLVADGLLPKVDNERQRELLEIICSAANERIAGRIGESATGGASGMPRPTTLSGESTYESAEKVRAYIAENMQHMTTEFLDRMEQICISSGLFVCAYAAREKNEELILQRASAGASFSRRDAVKLFWSYINRDEDDAARQMLSRLGIRGNPLTARQIQGLCRAFGLLPKKSPRALKKPEHAAFADYVKNKSIAIVGPASSETDHSEEIERDFDIVLKMNYRRSDNLPTSPHDVSKRKDVSPSRDVAERYIAPDVSYYRKYMNSVIANPDEDVNYLSDLDFAVFKQRDEKTLRRARAHTQARVVKLLPDFYFLGRHSMVQLVLHDLLNFEPSRIKVFNITLDLSETLYAKGYKTSEAEHKTLNQWLQMSSHNFVSQYDYTRNLYKRGLIDADTRLSEILNLGTAEYMRQMQEQEDRKEI